MIKTLIDTAIIVAIITLFGTIITAFAPIVINWFSKEKDEG